MRSWRPERPSHAPPGANGEATPGATVVPRDLTFHLPAHRGLAGCAWSAVESTIALVDRDLDAGTQLEEAVAVAAEAVIQWARPWTPLEISITVDDTDVYVRLSAALLDPDEPPRLDEHTQAMLRQNVESLELVHDRGTVLVVLQAPLAPPVSW